MTPNIRVSSEYGDGCITDTTTHLEDFAICVQKDIKITAFLTGGGKQFWKFGRNPGSIFEKFVLMLSIKFVPVVSCCGSVKFYFSKKVIGYDMRGQKPLISLGKTSALFSAIWLLAWDICSAVQETLSLTIGRKSYFQHYHALCEYTSPPSLRKRWPNFGRM